VKALKNILNKQIKNSSMMKEASVGVITAYANDLLEKKINLNTKIQARAMQVKDKVLTIACLSEESLKELKTKEFEIINNINQQFTENTIEKIRYLA